MRTKRRLTILGAIFLVLFSGCSKNDAIPKERDLLKIKSDTTQSTKKIILICVDSLMAETIDKGIRQHKLPTLQYLIEHGQYYPTVVTSFPTMSVSIDSTLLTGTYPNDHHLPGLVWYSSKDKKVINYGTGPLEISRYGMNNMLSNALVRLNGSHLNPDIPTIYEELTKKGLKSGSINGLIYRGSADHLLSFPLWLRVPTALPREIKVKGPDFLAFGALSNPLDGKNNLPESAYHNFGFNNKYSVEAVRYLIQNDKLPDFLYVYFPDLDQKVHKKGPGDLDGVIQTDKQLQTLIQTFGSREEAIRKAVIIIIGDNGMTRVLPADQQPVIDLHRMLNRYDVLRPGASVSDKTELVFAVNDRMAYIYKLKAKPTLEEIASTLRNESRFDVLAWKENGWIRVFQGGSFKELAYRGSGKMLDPYRQSWTLDKDPSVLDLQINKQKQTLAYGHYPDVLQRLSAALNSHAGEFMIVTAKPGYELQYGSSPTHEGGAGHGSIGKTEALIPLIISGTDQKPDSMRLVDLKRYLLQLLNI